MNWDDARYFLAVARGGSVRSAAARLKVNHATVLRRIAQLEQHLGSHVFDKLPAGYRLTDAGHEILELAEQMEAASSQMEARIFGRDQSLRGSLRFTLPPPLATHLLMPALAEFCRTHPEIEIELMSSFASVNLTMRQADVALRVVFEGGALPSNVHGIQGPELHGGVYVARATAGGGHPGSPDRPRWIAITEENVVDDTERMADVSGAGVPFKVTDAGAQLEAVRQGLGIAHLPCFIGDADETLVRLPGTPTARIGNLWLLTQGETRRTKRVRVFRDFLSTRLAESSPLLAGQRPRD